MPRLLPFIVFILYSNVVAILSSDEGCDMCVCKMVDSVLLLNCSATKTRPGDNNGMIRQPYPESYAQYKYNTMDAHFESNRIKILSRLSLRRVNSLSLDQNEITGIQPEIFVKLKTLKTLSLKYNKLQTLHEQSFQGLSSLEILDLSRNRLTNLPAGIFSALTSLKILSLSHNAIENLEGQVFSISQLQTLDVSFNSIFQIGLNVFERADKLRTLNLSNNNIITIESYQIPSLETLDLSFNRIVTVDKNAFSNLKSLKWLSLSSNNLKEVPSSVGMLAELRVLYLEANVIEDTGDAVQKLQLEELYVQDNNLRNFDVNAARLRVRNLGM